MQVYIKSPIRSGSTTTKLLTFLNRSWSICGRTEQSLVIVECMENIYCLRTYGIL